jgi:phospholipid/cholesterol/gamma-HCH transport system substrate-binding protein
MENKAHALAAGLFTVLLVLGVALAAMWFSGDTYEKAYYVVESKYAVTGLSEQAAVRYRGVNIGKVTRIEFDPANPRIILIDIAIQSGMSLTRSTFAELRYQGVTGLSYVMLDDPRTSTEPLPQAGEQGSARIPIRESVFSSLAEVAPLVLADAREVMKRMNTLMSDENQVQIGSALRNVEALTRQITALASAMEPAARGSDALVADARRTFQHADKLLAEIAGTNRDLAKRLEAIDRMSATTQNAGNAVSALADAVASETLPRINAMADELARTSRSLDRLASELKEQPQSLVFGRKPGAPGPGESGFEARAKGKK